jgi:hypothetical protein
LMINASRPTPRSWHIDIQHFAIQEWRSNGDIYVTYQASSIQLMPSANLLVLLYISDMSDA